MTLKKIRLSASALTNLYKYTLIQQQDSEKNVTQGPADIIFFGGNNRSILLLIDNAKDDFLPRSQLTFLSEILMACKLSMSDIAIVNLDKHDALKHKNIPGILQAEIVVLSDIEVSVLNLPFKIPPFQVQAYNGKKYVCIPSLHTIQNDDVMKRKLWNLLKILFAV